MKQLLMYRFPGEVICPALPEGCSIVNYSGEDDIKEWIACCSEGLVDPSKGRASFDEAILGRADIDPYRDVFFLDHNGVHVGTFTAFKVKADNTGDLHMFAVRPGYRGRGYAKYMAAAACRKMEAEGVRYTHLTTDDWRIPAVKTYIGAGFVPVEYAQGMRERWEKVLEDADIDSVRMVYEDGSDYAVIDRKGLAKPVRFGVVGAGRGRTMINYCMQADNARLVAVCDNWPEILDRAKKEYGTDGITYYSDFDEFIKHDMDCVVLANYANEHAPFAIKCLRHGKHVLSEVLPIQNMKEAVELIETIEEMGLIYAYAENYCYMPASRTMRRLYAEGRIGEFEYGEGEYMHNCEPIWPDIAYGRKDHWRNTMSALYYCTHSIGPLVHISGLRPVKVTGFEGKFTPRMQRMGAKAGHMGIEMITLENGALIKSIHGVGPSRSSIWYSVYGAEGRMESAREDAEHGGMSTLYVNNEPDDIGRAVEVPTDDELSSVSGGSGHGGSDFYTMYNMVQAVRGNRNAEIIDIFEALDMFLPGLFGYFSVIGGGVPMDIPDLRDKAEREKWRGDTRCTDPDAAGDMLLPSYSAGDPDIPDEIYGEQAEMYAKRNEKQK